MAKGLVSSKQYTIQVVRRSLLTPEPGSVEARHGETVLLTTRAKVKTTGASEWAQVDVDGEKVTHTFTIRYTTIEFDIRDRVRDARGHLWKILKIDEVAMANREYNLLCANLGSETEAANA